MNNETESLYFTAGYRNITFEELQSLGRIFEVSIIKEGGRHSTRNSNYFEFDQIKKLKEILEEDDLLRSFKNLTCLKIICCEFKNFEDKCWELNLHGRLGVNYK